MVKKSTNNTSSRARYNQRQNNQRQNIQRPNGGGNGYQRMQPLHMQQQSQSQHSATPQQPRTQSNGITNGHGVNGTQRQSTRFSNAPSVNSYQMARPYQGNASNPAQKSMYTPRTATADYTNGAEKRPLAYQTQNGSYYEMNGSTAAYPKPPPAQSYAQPAAYQANMPGTLYSTPPPQMQLQYNFPPPMK